MNKLDIKPVDRPGDSCTGHITGLTVAEINARLGFKPNVDDDPSKVKYSWGFTVNGERCGVWDWKGSHRDRIFSAWGNPGALLAVFGLHYKKG